MRINLLVFLTFLSFSGLFAQNIDSSRFNNRSEIVIQKQQIEVKLDLVSMKLEVILPNLDAGGNVTIFNANGQQVLSVFPESNALSIDVSKLKKGAYLIVYGESQNKFMIK